MQKQPQWCIRILKMDDKREYIEGDTIEHKNNVIKEYLDIAKHISFYDLNTFEKVEYK